MGSTEFIWRMDTSHTMHSFNGWKESALEAICDKCVDQDGRSMTTVEACSQATNGAMTPNKDHDSCTIASTVIENVGTNNVIDTLRKLRRPV